MDSPMAGFKRGMALAAVISWAWAAPVFAAQTTWSNGGSAGAASGLRGSESVLRGTDGTLARGMPDISPSQQLALALQAIHMTACAGAVERVANFLFEGQDARFIAQPIGPDADRWPTVFVIESADPAGGPNRFSTLMISSNCSGMYEQTVYWPQPCAVIKSTLFAKFTGEHPLLSEVQVSDSGPALQVYLTAAGAGCISTKKELFH
jgi:hypothetical protein